MPQGSVLGPLLFIIFINDLLNYIKSATPFIFADDTKCSHPIRSLEDVEKLQTDINNAAEWSYLSNFPFNETKFVYLRSWAKDTDHPSYVINGKSIKQLQQHKDLGVTFSIDLNWAAHHKVITVKAYQTSGLIRRTFKTGCSTEAKKKLYNNCLSSFTTDILFPAVEASIN